MNKEKMAHLEKNNTIIKSYTLDKVPDDAEKGYHFAGYLAYYDNYDRDGDKFVKGAFSEAIKKRTVYPMYYNHNTWDLSDAIGDLTVEETEKGVYAYGVFYDDIQDTNIQKAMKMVKRGALQEMSIGFGIEDIKEDADINENTPEHAWWKCYDFKKAYIREGSVVVTPANPEAKIDQKDAKVEPEKITEDKTPTRAEQLAKAMEDLDKIINK